MSEHDEQGTSDLERRLDAAFSGTRPRRGFEDELWARLRARRPWWQRLGDTLEHVPWGGVATGLAALVVVGLVVTLVRVGASHGGGGTSTASTTERPAAGSGAAGPSRPNTAALPFGPLPPPAAAGVIQAVRPAGPSALPADAQRAAVQGASPPPPPPVIPVYRFDPASGPAGGAIVEKSAVPPALPVGLYPSRSAPDAIAAAEERGAPGAPVVLTQVRLVYVAVVSGSEGFLEPAYLFTGSAGSAPVQVLVSALAPSALQ